MIKKITIERDCYFCDHCGKQLDWADKEYANNVYECYGSDMDLCRNCSDEAWQCYNCQKIFFESDGNYPIDIGGDNYCPSCATRYANDILKEVADARKGD